MAARDKLKQKLSSGAVATVLAGHSGSSGMLDFIGPLGFDGF